MGFNVRLFIEQIVQQELEEAAISMGAAQGLNYAMFVGKDKYGYTNVILYDPAKVPGLLNSELTDSVVGVVIIQFRDACKTWEVISSAATKGFGPLLYDCAFAVAGSEGLMSDRDSVKQAARNIWQHNFTTRKDDFEIVHLVKCRFGSFPDAKDNFLNYKYIIKNPLNLSGLVAAHDTFVEKMSVESPSFKKYFPEDLMSGAEEFFQKNYA